MIMFSEVENCRGFELKFCQWDFWLAILTAGADLS